VWCSVYRVSRPPSAAVAFMRRSTRATKNYGNLDLTFSKSRELNDPGQHLCDRPLPCGSPSGIRHLDYNIGYDSKSALDCRQRLAAGHVFDPKPWPKAGEWRRCDNGLPTEVWARPAECILGLDLALRRMRVPIWINGFDLSWAAPAHSAIFHSSQYINVWPMEISALNHADSRGQFAYRRTVALSEAAVAISRYTSPERRRDRIRHAGNLPDDAPNLKTASRFIHMTLLEPQVAADITTTSTFGYPDTAATGNFALDEDVAMIPRIIPSSGH